MRTLQIPNKSLFKLNEVCGLTGVKPYVLRFWESEFDEIDPIVSSSGQKLYEHKDIEAIALIKKLLFEDKMSIEETKAEMKFVSSSLSEKEVETNLDENETLRTSEIHQGFDLENPKLGKTDLSQCEADKLLFAKESIRKLLEITGSLKYRYNWN